MLNVNAHSVVKVRLSNLNSITTKTFLTRREICYKRELTVSHNLHNRIGIQYIKDHEHIK